MLETRMSHDAAKRRLFAEPAPRTGRLAALIRHLLDWHARMQQRRHLSALSSHMLKDIGLTAADVYAELGKKPWQI